MNNSLFIKNCIKKIDLQKKKCKQYFYYLKSINFKLNKVKKLHDIPFVHVNSFKKLDLHSLDRKKIHKTLISSGTTNYENRSKIFLDKKNSINQQKALISIISKYFGNHRRPMIICDKKPDIKNKLSFDASVAAHLGFSIFGKEIFYLLNQKGQINYRGLNKYLKKYINESKFIFGFTYNIYLNFLRNFLNSKINKKLFNNSIILHGGGWKKLIDLKIDDTDFKKKLQKKFGLNKICNYYGMIEQIGSIFIECDYCNCFHETDYTKILIRDENLNEINSEKTGLVQLISILPDSYPGNSILTEDLGYLVKSKKCIYQKTNEKIFKIIGRVNYSEIRGCSDAH